MTFRYDVNRPLVFTALAMLCVVPPLIPIHTHPSPTFYEEWAAALFALSLAGLVAARSVRAPFMIPAIAVPLCGFLAVLLVQLFVERSTYRQPIEWAILYTLLAILLAWTGSRLREMFELAEIADTMARALLVTGIVGGIAAIAQVYGVPELLQGVVLPLVFDKRPYANIGQSNLHATFTVAALASLVYLVASGRVSRSFAGVSAGVMLVGLSLAGSRMSIGFLVALAVGALVIARRARSPDARLIRATRLAWLVVAGFIAIDLLLDVTDLAYSRGSLARVATLVSEGDYASDGLAIRLHVWRIAWETFLAHPFLGTGMGGFAWEYFQRSTEGAGADGVRAFVAHAHNLILQLLVDTGIAGTACVALALGLWSLRFGRVARDLEHWWIGSLCGVVLLHAMVEFPLWYAEFLTLFALLVGLAETRVHSVRLRIFGTATMAAIVFVGFALLGVLYRDHDDLQLWIATSDPLVASDPPDARDRALEALPRLRRGLFQPEVERLLALRMSIDAADLDRKIALNDVLMRHIPNHEVLIRQVLLLQLGGREREASVLLSRALHTFPGIEPAVSAMLAKLVERDRATFVPLVARLPGRSTANRVK